MGLTCAYVGNFRPSFSTESHVAESLEEVGVEVMRLQEDDGAFHLLLDGCADDCHFVMWTRTGWDPPVSHDLQLDARFHLAHRGVPLVGYHLDRWWGLNREGQVLVEPFFGADLVITADGGHDEQWARAGVEHVWFPPAVLRREAATPGVPRDEYRSKVAFVGSWRSYGHPEWQYRVELIRQLRRRYRHELGLWPKAEAVREQALADLYASVDVVVGDSCLAGGATHYWSDRVPETIGRGAFLVHPRVEGLAEQFTADDGRYVGPISYELGDWSALFAVIDEWLADPAARSEHAAVGRDHVLREHTYTRRMEQLLELLDQRGML